MVQTANDITVSKEKMQNRSHRIAWESNKKAWNIEKKVLYKNRNITTKTIAKKQKNNNTFFHT